MSTNRDFVTPIFRGGRFEDAVLSVDVLADLAAYRDLVVELAKRLFLRREPGRKRVPKGFAESFQLGIRAIEKGSTLAVVSRTFGGSQPPLPLGAADDFDAARDLLERVIEAGAAHAPLPAEFPPELAMRFNQFGRGLRDGESVELRRAGAASGPRYDRAIRKWIVVQREGRYEDAVDRLVVVRGGFIDRHMITVRLDDGALVEGTCEEAVVKRALALADQRARLTGLGSFDGQDRLERLVRVDDVVDADEEEERASTIAPALVTQFARLAALEEGWFEPGTPKLRADGLARVRAFLEAATASGAPLPYLYPTPAGEVRAEWSLGRWEVSATFDVATPSVWLHATHLDSEATEEADLPTDADAVATFVAFVAQLAARAEAG